MGRKNVARGMVERERKGSGGTKLMGWEGAVVLFFAHRPRSSRLRAIPRPLATTMHLSGCLALFFRSCQPKKKVIAAFISLVFSPIYPLGKPLKNILWGAGLGGPRGVGGGD